MLHEDRFVLRLFLLLVVLSMVAELGGIITLNVLGQVIRSDFLCCGSWIVFHAINERNLLTALDCICQKR